MALQFHLVRQLFLLKRLARQLQLLGLRKSHPRHVKKKAKQPRSMDDPEDDDDMPKLEDRVGAKQNIALEILLLFIGFFYLGDGKDCTAMEHAYRAG
ncbi:conserved hypothetical protein [Ricinus communis]|uniref:Uncharacterized protein n=1 Tax=Ricinus communis TaxID=3988 RepID=B9SVW9_RICCO|nr:conserved hypothetical protein [Ricinus communis]